MRVEWNEGLSVGIPEIDAQHRDLLDTYNVFVDACGDGCDSGELRRLFDFLTGYASYHFGHEERVQRTLRYPDFAIHKEQHRALLRQLLGLQERFRADGATPEMVAAVGEFMSGWMREHMFGMDRALASFIRNRAATGRRCGPPPSGRLHALRIAALALAAIVLVEAVEMLLIRFVLPPLSPISEVLLDAGLLFLIGAPAVYLLVARPLVRLAEERRSAEGVLELDAARFETLYDLLSLIDEPEERIKDFALEAAVQMTRSGIGYLYMVDAEEKRLELHAWSKNVMPKCRVAEKKRSYLVEETGLWGEAVRQRRPIITNDYPAPSPLKRGVPDGHVPVRRHMNLPLIEDGRIVLLVGVGNKEEPYDESDVRQLSLLMRALWKTLERKWGRESLTDAVDRLRERQDFLDLVLSHLQSGIIVTDLSENVTLANAYARSKILRLPDDRETLPAFRELCPELAAAVEQGKDEGEIEVTSCRPPITVGYKRFDFRSPRGEKIGDLIACIDLTGVVEMQRQLKRNERLATMGEVVGMISHEIRNPLTTIKAVTQILAMEAGLQPQLKELLDAMLGEIGRMGNLLNDLTDTSREMKLDLKEIDLPALIDETVRLNGPILAERKIALGREIPKGDWKVAADRGRVRQVLENLLRNAVEATPHGGNVTISLERETDAVAIRVADSGRGIPAGEVEKIFDPFFTTKKKGSGIGLFVSKRIADAHGGTLSAENLAGGGASFCLRLPPVACRPATLPASHAQI